MPDNRSDGNVVFIRMGASRSEFEDFVIGASDRLLRAAVAITADPDAARDLLQDVLERMYVRWPRIEDPHAYAVVSLANGNRNRLVRRRRRPEAPLQEVVATSADLADAVADQQSLLAALRQLPRQQRTVLVLRFLEDLSTEQTAAVLRCSTGAVKSHTSRAVRRLRELLDETTTSAPGGDAR